MYTPVDVTPPELQPHALTNPEPWIIDTQTNPTQITNWDQRQAAAVVPYELDANGWPLNPTGRTGRTGRNLGAWGENAAADPVVIAGTGSDRHILLIQRGDTGQWAIPGGMVDPGETAPAALVRELAEETGVDLSGMSPRILWRGYVNDPRNTDHAWITTTVALYWVTEMVPTMAGDDATDAHWWPWAGDVNQLAEVLDDHGGLYDAHRTLLVRAAQTHY